MLQVPKTDQQDFLNRQSNSSNLILPIPTDISRRNTKRYSRIQGISAPRQRLPQTQLTLDNQVIQEQEDVEQPQYSPQTDHLRNTAIHIPQHSEFKIGFKAFKSLRDSKQNIKAIIMSQQQQITSSKEQLSNHLSQQQKEKKSLEKLVQSIQKDKYDNLLQQIAQKQSILKKIPKIRSHPSSLDQIAKKLVSTTQKTNTNNNAYGIMIQQQQQQSNNNEITKIDKNQRSFIFSWQSMVIQENGMKPEIRECFSFICIGNYGYIHGGISMKLLDDIWRVNLDTLQWQRIIGGDQLQGKCGHSSHGYNRNLIIFGGERKYNNTLIKMRECLNEIKIINIDKPQWKIQKTAGEVIEPRRHHVSTFIAKTLIVHGGLNSKGVYLNDICTIQMTSLRWVLHHNLDTNTTNVDTTNNNNTYSTNNTNNKLGVAYHQCANVFSSERRFYNIYKYIENNSDLIIQGPDKILIEGIYYFGGKNQQGDILNKLRILKLGESQLKWVTPDTKGTPPTPRYLHSMQYYDPTKILIVYGGRNDKLISQLYLNDIVVLDVLNLCWCYVNVSGVPREPRGGHSTIIYNTKLYIFGGVNIKGYCSINIDILELDQFISRQQYNTELNNIQIQQQQQQQQNEKEFNSQRKFTKFNQLQPTHTRSFSGFDSIVSIVPIKKKYSYELNTPFKTFMPLPSKEELQLTNTDAQSFRKAVHKVVMMNKFRTNFNTHTKDDTHLSDTPADDDVGKNTSFTYY